MTHARRQLSRANVALSMLLVLPAVPAMAQEQEQALPIVRESESGQRVTIEQERSARARTALPGTRQNSIQLQLGDGPATTTETTLTYERKIPLQVTVEFPPSRMCSAEIALSYAQMNTNANVEGELSNADCAASGGDYTIAVSFRDANGESQTLEFTETWQRIDDATLSFETNYPIGENVDLTRVRARRVSCTCAEVPEAPLPAE